MDRLEVAKGVEATRDFALFLRDERALVISDLHLGFEGALAEQGVSIPRFQRRGIPERPGQKLHPREDEKEPNPGGVQNHSLENRLRENGQVTQGLPVPDDYATSVLVPQE